MLSTDRWSPKANIKGRGGREKCVNLLRYVSKGIQFSRSSVGDRSSQILSAVWSSGNLFWSPHFLRISTQSDLEKENRHKCRVQRTSSHCLVNINSVSETFQKVSFNNFTMCHKLGVNMAKENRSHSITLGWIVMYSTVKASLTVSYLGSKALLKFYTHIYCYDHQRGFSLFKRKLSLICSLQNHTSFLSGPRLLASFFLLPPPPLASFISLFKWSL